MGELGRSYEADCQEVPRPTRRIEQAVHRLEALNGSANEIRARLANMRDRLIRGDDSKVDSGAERSQLAQVIPEVENLQQNIANLDDTFSEIFALISDLESV